MLLSLLKLKTDKLVVTADFQHDTELLKIHQNVAFTINDMSIYFFNIISIISIVVR